MNFDGNMMAIIVFALVVLTITMGVRQVPQGYEYTVERFGRYSATLRPGLNLIVPWIDRIGRRVNMMEQVLQVTSQEVITRDNASVTADGVIFYQILDAAHASYAITNLEIAMTNLVQTNIRTVLGSMDLDQVLSHRDEINRRLLAVVDAAIEPWGIKGTRIEIKDILPPRDIVDAMGRQMKAEREKRASILEAEGARQAEILRAEGRKQSAVLEAEGRRESAYRDAEARERSAEAEAQATRVVSQAIAEGDIASLNYFVAEKYVRAIDNLARAPNQKVFIMPVDLAGLAGVVGGISELTQAAQNETRARNNTIPAVPAKAP